ncbi:DUF5681 domain-containing protein [Roseovarius pacificus]|uniref:DUF5681 domain-containing protein n=1 Tax=Roseovarius pacificus TaxID=337701 RepID=UPI002A18AD82|nr:DUF5681 domain-containing protein [Roseovarius pacificus]
MVGTDRAGAGTGDGPVSGSGTRDTRGQFRKGTSGNPKGRPKKPATERSSPFDVVVDRELTITRNGQPRTITMEEALQHRTYQDALAGKRMAEREVLKWIEKREDWYRRHASDTSRDKVEFKMSPSPDNAKEALEVLGIVSRDERFDETDTYAPRQLLEPWAVQAAFDRRRGVAPLTDTEVASIRRCTRNPDTLRWPKERS